MMRKLCLFKTRHRPAQPEADLRSRPSEERVHTLIKNRAVTWQEMNKIRLIN